MMLRSVVVRFCLYSSAVFALLNFMSFVFVQSRAFFLPVHESEDHPDMRVYRV